MRDRAIGYCLLFAGTIGFLVGAGVKLVQGASAGMVLGIGFLGAAAMAMGTLSLIAFTVDSER